MHPERERFFNVPGVILALVVLLFAIHGVRQTLSDETNLSLLRLFGFVPGRFTFAFDPQRVADAFAAATGRSAVDGAVARFFLGDGKPLWWTPVTYAFLHGSWLHVGFNNLWLLAFGAPVARRFGTLRFLIFCLVAAIAGAIVHYLTHIDDLQPVVGASAVVSGTMAAATRFVFQPSGPLGGRMLGGADEAAFHQPALPLLRVFTERRAVTFLAAWFIANFLFGVAPQLSGLPGVTIAWQAHIGGFLVGLLAFPLFDPHAAPDLAADLAPQDNSEPPNPI